nr:TVP38/TMEM64 family protein [Desulfobulbaceae bacterium]
MNKLGQKIVILAVGVLCVGLFVYFDLDQYLTLAYLKESQAQLLDIYTNNPWRFIAGYMVVYVLVTGLSLPGAVVLTLAGGGLFGLVVGTVVVSFASTIGATLACLVSRFLLQDWVQGKFGDKLVAINQGIETEGAFYLFTLRLIPVFPFFVINLVMGLTTLPIRTFFWVSQLGMLAGTMVFVNAGKELAKIDSLSGILSPGLLFSFAVLGVFPITVKRLLVWYKAKFMVG